MNVGRKSIILRAEERGEDKRGGKGRRDFCFSCVSRVGGEKRRAGGIRQTYFSFPK